MAKVTELAGGAIKELDLPPEIERKLIDIQAEVASAYRDHFIEMVQTMKEQASALDRIQATLRILVDAVAPELSERFHRLSGWLRTVSGPISPARLSWQIRSVRVSR
jgi:hypothetical protein